MKNKRTGILALLLMVLLATPAAAIPQQPLWGDTHLHTSNSFDAFLNRNLTADPETAYKYARGLPVIHPGNRSRVQIETPLDFMVIADHAEFYGGMRHAVQRGIPRDGLSTWQSLFAGFNESALKLISRWDYGREFFGMLLPGSEENPEESAANPSQLSLPGAEAMSQTMWQEAILTADEYNEPGVFTALIGWEWSSIPAGANLHRVVFTNADAPTAGQFQPLSSIETPYPRELWQWLDETSKRTGADFVAIPHNSNISKGRMFDETLLGGEAYTPRNAQARAYWEPVVEATQFKGDSETHPDLSPDDPFADFETYPFYIQTDAPPYEPRAGDYVRSALLRGLAIEEKIGFNPYRFGLIGSTDSHTGLASAEEPNFWGKFPRDSTPETKANKWRSMRGPTGWSMSASGLAAVWAEQNTRDAILEAFRRREVYATTGPRMTVRVFGGWDFEEENLQAANVAKLGYERGVPMGGDLGRAPIGAQPRFLLQALKDPRSAHLDRMQVVKGWIDDGGTTREKVYDVAWSGDRVPNTHGRVSPVGNTVNEKTAGYTNDIGAADLSAVWRDPDFNPSLSSFYYVRVLEIPTPRHSLFDTVALGVAPQESSAPTSVQERAYTSPIWYRPASESEAGSIAEGPSGTGSNNPPGN